MPEIVRRISTRGAASADAVAFRDCRQSVGSAAPHQTPESPAAEAEPGFAPNSANASS